MMLQNEEINRFKSGIQTPTDLKNKSSDLIVKGYTKYGDVVDVRKSSDKFYTLDKKRIEIRLWEYKTEQKYEFKHILKEKPVLNPDQRYILVVDKYGNESIAYKKNDKYLYYSNNREVNFLLWRYLIGF